VEWRLIVVTRISGPLSHVHVYALGVTLLTFPRQNDICIEGVVVSFWIVPDGKQCYNDSRSRVKRESVR
jgi:hypothetical protein